jgi:hypothetical protein
MEHVILVRRKNSGDPEAWVVEFQTGIKGFLEWVKSLDDEFLPIDAGGRWVLPAGFPEKVYETDSQANTFAFGFGIQAHLAAWKLTDMQWFYLKNALTEREQVEGRVGRRANPVRQLQTWRGWAKKAGAVI